MQRKFTPLRELAVDADQVLHRRHLRGQTNFISAHTPGHGLLSTLYGRSDEGLPHHRARIPRVFARRILVHQPRQELLVETAPVHTDAYGTVVLQRGLHHGPKLGVTLGAPTHVPGVNTVLRERHRTFRHLRQELVAVEVKISH